MAYRMERTGVVAASSSAIASTFVADKLAAASASCIVIASTVARSSELVTLPPLVGSKQMELIMELEAFLLSLALVLRFAQMCPYQLISPLI